MKLKIEKLPENETAEFKEEILRAFSRSDMELDEAGLDEKLHSPESVTYKVLTAGMHIGGVTVTVKGDKGYLDFIYVYHQMQNMGFGSAIWRDIEKMYPEVKVWETVAPYAYLRNTHFFVNLHHFRAIEIFDKHHPAPAHAIAPNEDILIRYRKTLP